MTYVYKAGTLSRRQREIAEKFRRYNYTAFCAVGRYKATCSPPKGVVGKVFGVQTDTLEVLVRAGNLRKREIRTPRRDILSGWLYERASQ